MSNKLESKDGLRVANIIIVPTGVSVYNFSEKDFPCLFLLINIDININKEIADKLQEFVEDFLENDWGTWSVQNILDLIPLNVVYELKIFNRNDKNFKFQLEGSDFFAYITEDYKKDIPKNIPIQRYWNMTLQDILYLDTGGINRLKFTSGALFFQEGVIQKADSYKCWDSLTVDTLSSILKFKDNGKALAKTVVAKALMSFQVTDIARNGTLSGRYICFDSSSEKQLLISGAYRGKTVEEIQSQDLPDELAWIEM